MDPVFTLQWPEFLLANRLQRLLPKSQGYSVLIPASRQEKGFDVAIIRKLPNRISRVATIQIKASRVYLQRQPNRASTTRFCFHTWFNRFDVPKEADFFLLFGLYAPDAGRTKTIGTQWYRDCTLMFSRKEMKKFMAECLTRGGKQDRMFGFGFDDERKVVQTRGDKDRQFKDFTQFLLSKRVALIKAALRG